jgi:glycosyltransferase involved in cell wall biosynthesis
MLRPAGPGAAGGQQPLRVAMSVISQAASQRTGTWTYARELMRELGRRPAAIRLQVLANEHGWAGLDSALPNTVTVRRARGFRVGNRRVRRLAALATAAAAPRRLERQLPGDLALVHYPLTLNLPPVRCPRVMTLHDVQHHDLPEAFSLAQRLWRAKTYDQAARDATMVVTDSEHARGRIIDVLGIDESRVATVHLGVDHERFTPEPEPDEAVRMERLALPARFVLYPASLWPHKNHSKLLDALARVEDRSLSLVLTGVTFGQGKRLMNEITERGLAARVVHLGLVADAVVPALYRAAQALVFPSRYEGFGVPPLEAMACGCPVASTLSGSLREVCGAAVVVLDPDDPEQMAGAIARVVDDIHERRRLTVAGFEQARRFTWQRSADQLLDAYHRAIALDRGGPAAGRSQYARRGSGT